MGQPMTFEKLLQRNKCCGLKCQNCPYEPKYEKETSLISKETYFKLVDFENKNESEVFLGAKYRFKKIGKQFCYLECTRCDTHNNDIEYTYKWIDE